LGSALPPSVVWTPSGRMAGTTTQNTQWRSQTSLHARGGSWGVAHAGQQALAVATGSRQGHAIGTREILGTFDDVGSSSMTPTNAGRTASSSITVLGSFFAPSATSRLDDTPWRHPGHHQRALRHGSPLVSSGGRHPLSRVVALAPGPWPPKTSLVA